MSKPEKFKARLPSHMRVLYKDEDRMVIWGPASVDIVDKEGDRITAEALEDALPQLLRRSRLSLEHSDQLVGDIKDKFETDEPVTVEIDGQSYKSSVFPTAVLDKEKDGVPHTGLYVAGEVWADTQQARDTREKIKRGVIDSYSISGEAITSGTRVKEDTAFDEITEMDLSAVTLCEEGMNQKAKFATVSKDRATELAALAKSAIKNESESMTEKEEEEDPEGGVEAETEDDTMDNVSEGMAEKAELEQMFKDAAHEVMSDMLPEGELATKEDVYDDETLQEKVAEWTSAEKGDYEDDEDEPEMPESDDDEDDMDKGGLEAKVDRVLELLDDEDEEYDDEIPLDDEEEEMPPEEEGLDDVDVDDLEDPDEDGEMEVDFEEEEEDDEVEMGDTHNVDLDTLKSALPEDLYSAVTDHLSDPSAGSVGKSEMEEELPEDVFKAVEEHLENFEKADPEPDPTEVAKSDQEYLREITAVDVDVSGDGSFEKSEEEKTQEANEVGDSNPALDNLYEQLEG